MFWEGETNPYPGWKDSSISSLFCLFIFCLFFFYRSGSWCRSDTSRTGADKFCNRPAVHRRSIPVHMHIPALSAICSLRQRRACSCQRFRSKSSIYWSTGGSSGCVHCHSSHQRKYREAGCSVGFHLDTRSSKKRRCRTHCIGERIPNNWMSPHRSSLLRMGRAADYCFGTYRWSLFRERNKKSIILERYYQEKKDKILWYFFILFYGFDVFW